MTQKEKELLLQDLCARLPYGLIVTNKLVDNGHICKLNPYSLRIGYFIDSSRIDETKIFLRPMSSMTEDELYDWTHTWIMDTTVEKYDWLNKHHLDYRGLIPMGLALEAPKDMYIN